MYHEDFKITKREILASISIIAFLLVLGFIISDCISNKIADKNEKYTKAIKIENEEIFDYGMRTNVGNAFVYGELKAVDSVSYPDINGEFLYIEKRTQRYTKHTRTYTVKVGKTTQVRTEVYWTWDTIDSESKHSKKIEFCGIVFPYSKIVIPDSEHINTISTGYRMRDVYSGTVAKHKGTVFTKLKNKTISNKSLFYKNRKIAETQDDLIENEKSWLIIFWVLWIILVVACVIGFYYLENNWLEDKKR